MIDHPGPEVPYEGGELREPPLALFPAGLLPGFDSFEFIGQGGMGAVYRARQISLDRIVAVKLLAVPYGQDRLDFTGRFEVEARAMARLAHPNVVAVHDYGVSEGQPYLVMELVEGEDLATRLAAGGPLPSEEAKRIALSVAGALHYAHALGVVHRDIKPSNILLGRDGRVRLADFGLAKIDERTRRASLTLSNTSMGSLDYAAPEVISRPVEADSRADVYSLGVVLYEMLTGSVPRGLFKLPSEKVPGLDSRFDAIVCRAMEEDPTDRYADVAHLCGDLEAVIGTCPPGKKKRRSGSIAIAAAGVAAGVLAVFAVIQLQRADSVVDSSTDAISASTNDGWQSLLPRVDLERDVAEGYWKAAGGGFATRYGIGRNDLILPVSLEGPCDLRFRLSRGAPSAGTVNLVFRFGEKRGRFTLSDYVHPYAGLGDLEGKPTKESGLAVSWPTSFLLIGESREFTLHLRDSGFSADCEGVEFYRWEGDWSTLASNRESEGPNRSKEADLSLSVSHGLVTLHDAGVRPLRGKEGHSLPPRPSSGDAMSPDPPSRESGSTGHRYQFVPGAYTWEEARQAARSLGGQLLCCESREEHDWVWRTLSPWLPAMAERNSASRGWWTGGSKAAGEMEWRWIDGGPPSFEAWTAPMGASDEAMAIVQHHLAPEGALSGWTPRPLSTRLGFVVEWDPSTTQTLLPSDEETRAFASWWLHRQRSESKNGSEHSYPDLMVEGGTRNLRKASELPEGPFAITRVRVQGLRIDEEARDRLAVMGRMTRLYDVRFYSAPDAEILLHLRDLPRLGTAVLTAGETGIPPMDDSLLAALAHKPLLGILRLDGWSRLSGTGLSHLSVKAKLRTLTLNDCPDLSDAGLAEIATFQNLEELSLSGASGFSEAGLASIKKLRKLRSLGLERTMLSDPVVDDLRAALPDCEVLE